LGGRTQRERKGKKVGRGFFRKHGGINKIGPGTLTIIWKKKRGGLRTKGSSLENLGSRSFHGSVRERVGCYIRGRWRISRRERNNKDEGRKIEEIKLPTLDNI